VALASVTDTGSVLVADAYAIRVSTAAIVRWSSAIAAWAQTGTVSTEPARARMGGLVKTAKLLNVRTTALVTVSATTALVSVTLVGLDLTAPQRNVLENQTRIPAVVMGFAIELACSAIAKYSGRKLTAPEELVPTTAVIMVSVMMGHALALLAGQAGIAVKQLA